MRDSGEWRCRHMSIICLLQAGNKRQRSGPNRKDQHYTKCRLLFWPSAFVAGRSGKHDAPHRKIRANCKQDIFSKLTAFHGLSYEPAPSALCQKGKQKWYLLSHLLYTSLRNSSNTNCSAQSNLTHNSTLHNPSIISWWNIEHKYKLFWLWRGGGGYILKIVKCKRSHPLQCHPLVGNSWIKGTVWLSVCRWFFCCTVQDCDEIMLKNLLGNVRKRKIMCYS